MEESGLGQLLLTMRPRLLRFLGARGIPLDQAEDLFQDLFLKLSERPSGPIGQPTAYIFQVANNLLLDRRRSRLRREQRENSWSGADVGEDVETDTRPSAEHVLIARDDLRLVERVLNALPPRTSEIFRKYRLHDQAQKQIAADLAISVSAVEKHLQRAYRELVEARRALDADFAEARRLECKDDARAPSR